MRTVPPEMLSFCSTGNFRGHSQTGLGIDEGYKSQSHYRMVIRDENTHRVGQFS